MSTHEREIVTPTQLSEHGRLRREAVGWYRQPLHDARIECRWGRRKRWKDWCGLGPQLSAEEHMARYGCPPCPCACSNGVLVCAPCAVCMPQAVSDGPVGQ